MNIYFKSLPMHENRLILRIGKNFSVILLCCNGLSKATACYQDLGEFSLEFERELPVWLQIFLPVHIKTPDLLADPTG
jgi:hypothetical protein